jgi:predicted metal-dependent phosphoesterase TrpH
MGRADLHIHTLASDGVSSVAQILDYAETQAELDVIAITDHERIDAAQAAHAMAAARGMRVEVIVGEEVSTRGGHVVGLFMQRRIRPWGSIRSTIAQIHEQGGLAIIAHPLVPYPLCASGRTIRRLLDEQDATYHPDAIEAFNPTTAGMHWGARAPEFVARSGVAAIGASDAHRAEHVGQALTTFEGTTADDIRAAILARTTGWEGSTHEWKTQFSTFRRQMGKNALAVRDEVRGKVLRDGTGRDLGYPGGRLRPARLDESGLQAKGANE